MSFNTALTGMRAANTALEVSGNNIANASTVGFKQSRAEFADVYASSVVGGGSDAVGNGVRVSDIAQQFAQGNVGFTESALDMAVNGGGFFVLNDNGSQSFTRAGQFSVDSSGFIVTNAGARLQGFGANEAGDLAGIISDLQLVTVNIDPRQTTGVEVGFNLTSDASVLAERGSNVTSSGVDIGVLQAGTTLQGNGYGAGTVDINGTTVNIPSAADMQANAIAAELSLVDEVTAAATNSATLTYAPGGGGTVIGSGELRINGFEVTGVTALGVAQSINSQSGLSATELGGVITITANNGADLVFDVSNGSSALAVTVDGTTITENGGGGGDEFITKGGTVLVSLEENATFTAGTGGVFSANPLLVPFETNTFDPTNPSTSNYITSSPVYDSLGAKHALEMFFVKESTNNWSMYVQIDGQNVGDPDPLLPPGSPPTEARYAVSFNDDGSLDLANTDPILISNWTPLNADGTPNGAFPPLNVVDGGIIPVPVPASSSNFAIDISRASQFSADESSTNSLDQNGFSTGQLTSLDIDGTGIIFARYSNGEALTLGQVVLADFSNTQGLTPVGNTSWAESFLSGSPVIGAPTTAALGAIQSGALEESNVDLAEELVALIIAQRNFQANARTIETANEVTQTIINLR
jgi:flagellar hook protein FlgE